MGKEITRPKLINAEPLPRKRLRLYYENGEIREFDAQKYIDNSHLFAHLADEKRFTSLLIKTPYVAFDENTDFSPQTLYEESEIANA